MSEHLRQALKRIAEATPGSTNSMSANDALAWCAAVANTALDGSPNSQLVGLDALYAVGLERGKQVTAEYQEHVQRLKRERDWS